jgi:hypothetical protein
MEQLTINIYDKSKLTLILELFKSWDFAGIVKLETIEGDGKEEIIQNIKQGLAEMKLVEQGKLKSRPIKDLLDEL